jgi:hypothetical protein
MDHAKFCPATQGWSTLECMEPFALLRRCALTKQEEDHARPIGAMPLRAQGPRNRPSLNCFALDAWKIPRALRDAGWQSGTERRLDQKNRNRSRCGKPGREIAVNHAPSS